ncbi:hypothetical protein BCR33DRAFT_38347 [Rhizoclosmatium globosum]|uniref:Uncharacterized protein n=1 Tax=Rhizoclosmatium globosum TaxID=329046 RepID=A0A1Y2CND7_9FUNG|nr:hypothetical protein BCR33DRAFT_38347 [Rhizoclosmatium globosum]|eukprot:ORY48550.1 hypothetical protein BCR33DRAFT_38347 [Rhizoclosmatium globosum]
MHSCSLIELPYSGDHWSHKCSESIDEVEDNLNFRLNFGKFPVPRMLDALLLLLVLSLDVKLSIRFGARGGVGETVVFSILSTSGFNNTPFLLLPFDIVAGIFGAFGTLLQVLKEPASFVPMVMVKQNQVPFFLAKMVLILMNVSKLMRLIFW